MKKIVGSFGCRLLRDEDGQSVVIVSLFVGLLALGFMAFALDTGMLFREKRMAQSAAQAAAVAAAEQAGYGQTSNEQAVADAMAKLNGFDTTKTTDPATVTLSAPTSGNFTGSYVQATVSMPIHTYFLGAFSKALATVPVSATAIAGGGVTSQTCVCVSGNFLLSGDGTLNTTASGSNNSCGIFDNSTNSSSIQMNGGSHLNAMSLASAATGWYPCNLGLSGQCNDSGDTVNSSILIKQGVTSTCAPVLPAAPVFNPSSCLSDPGSRWSNGGSLTEGPSTPGGTICYKSLTVGGSGMYDTLNSGIYVIYGGELHFTGNGNTASNGTPLGGNGVFFYLTNNASLVIDGGATVNLISGGATERNGGTALNLGSYDGILLYQVPGDANPITFGNGSTLYINGGIIAPSASVTFNGGSSATNYQGGFSVQNLTISNGATVNALVDTNQGSLAVGGSPTLVQ